MNRLSPKDYKKAHKATLEALSMIPAGFTLKQLTQDTNILLEPVGVVATEVVVDKRLKEWVRSGSVALVKPMKQGRGKGRGKGRIGKMYKLVGSIPHTGPTFAPKQKTEGLPEISGLTPQDVSKFMLNYMTKTLNIMGTINDIDTVRKDAATVHELQERNQELVLRHNRDQQKLASLLREKEKWSNLTIRYERLSKHHDELANKLAEMKKFLS